MCMLELGKELEDFNIQEKMGETGVRKRLESRVQEIRETS